MTRDLAPTQLLAYSFGPDADFEGRLVGALERIEAGGALSVLEVLFLRRDEGGELVALDLPGRSGRGLTAPLLRFRLEPAARRRATERALGGSGVGPETLQSLAAGLDPGCALVALLVEHTWTRALADAVARTGGTELVADFVEAAALDEVAGELLTATTPIRTTPL